MDERLDLCIIGAGTAGFAAAEAAREHGCRFLIVSGTGPLGGTCIRNGCMPAKTLLASTERLGLVEESEAVGVESKDVHVDMPAIIARKRELVDYFAEDRVHELEHYPLLRGTARFVAENAIAVGDRRIESERFIIASGSSLCPPAIPGLAECGYLTSDDVLNMERLPRSIAVIGAGPVGCEFAQYFARLGVSVTLLQSEAEILRNEDRDLAGALHAALERDGFCVMCGVDIARVRRRNSSPALALEAAKDGVEVCVDAILVTAERRPNAAALELAQAGVRCNDGAVAVDETLQTQNPHVFAAGDVIGRRCLVHTAAAAGRIAASNALSGERKSIDFDRLEAHGVYTQPQLAVAGLTEALCRERGLDVLVAREHFADVGKSIVSAEPEGFLKMLTTRDGRVVGVGIVGANAIDLIAEAMVWLHRRATATDIASLQHLHPTASEIYGRVAERVSRLQ